MRDADRRVGLVDVLAAGAGGAEGVDAKIRRGNLDGRFVGFHRDDRDRRRRGVDPPLRFRGRHALHAVRARFELEFRIRAGAFHARDHFLEAAVFARAGRFHFDAPALAFGEARIHAEEVAGEDRRLVATGAGAHFQIDVAVVARVLRDEVREQFDLERFQPRLCRCDLLVGEVAHAGVVAQRLRGGEVLARAALVAQRGGHRLELRELARKPAELRGVADHGGVGKQALELLAAFGEGFELAAQGGVHGSDSV